MNFQGQNGVLELSIVGHNDIFEVMNAERKRFCRLKL